MQFFMLSLLPLFFLSTAHASMNNKLTIIAVTLQAMDEHPVSGEYNVVALGYPAVLKAPDDSKTINCLKKALAEKTTVQLGIDEDTRIKACSLGIAKKKKAK